MALIYKKIQKCIFLYKIGLKLMHAKPICSKETNLKRLKIRAFKHDPAIAQPGRAPGCRKARRSAIGLAVIRMLCVQITLAGLWVRLDGVVVSIRDCRSRDPGSNHKSQIAFERNSRSRRSLLFFLSYIVYV